MYTVLFLACLIASSLAGPTGNNGAIGACLGDKCPTGFACVHEECVPTKSKRAATCPKEKAIGACLNDLCPKGYTCDGTSCC